MRRRVVACLFGAIMDTGENGMKYDTRLCWLPFLGETVPEGPRTCLEMAEMELAAGLAALGHRGPARVELLPGQEAGYRIVRAGQDLLVQGGTSGVLYGAYALLMRLAAGLDPAQPWTTPAFSLRMLNHWDNMDGTVERGYAGASLFFSEGRFHYDAARIRRYGRYLASVGINVVSINNVNVHPPADQLVTSALLPELARVADLLRPFGIRLLVAVDYALPVTCGLETADPLDARTQRWWREQADLVYRYIPDLCGFLIKADSEFRPGPYLYGRNHAEGASVLARALKPYGGVLVWRCFVYNCRQDWRDGRTDRPMAAYDTYVPLEGQFDDNVILQIKYGPYDFQVREPVSPLFYAMPSTAKALELQLAQEYTGQQIDLYYMPPQWAEIRGALDGHMPSAVCAVSNLGNDDNWTGHDLAQANLFAYGVFAWRPDAQADETARIWTLLTFGLDAGVEDTVVAMLLSSREIYERYTSPLGLCWMVNPHTHYGPSPEGYEYSAWGTYIRTSHEAVGIDRTSRGTGFTAQYPAAIAAQYDDATSCPEALLLFFHRLPFTHRLAQGGTLIQHIYDSHFLGAQQAGELQAMWQALESKLPDASFANVAQRLALQVKNAREWRDVINTYFHRYSGIPDEQGRKIYP